MELLQRDEPAWLWGHAGQLFSHPPVQQLLQPASARPLGKERGRARAWGGAWRQVPGSGGHVTSPCPQHGCVFLERSPQTRMGTRPTLHNRVGEGSENLGLFRLFRGRGTLKLKLRNLLNFPGWAAPGRGGGCEKQVNPCLYPQLILGPPACP